MDLVHVEALEPAQLESLTRWRPGDAWLAGGTWLFSEPQPDLRRLLDLHSFGWEPLRITAAGLEIAATCTLAELATFAPPARWPAGSLLRQASEALLGSFKIWNEATVGGNICLSLPAGPMTSLTASLDGLCEIWNPDRTVEHVRAAQFVTGRGTNVLRPGGLLRSITLPDVTLRSRTAFRQFSRTPLGRSAAVVIGRRDPDPGATVFTVTAAVTHPVQLRFATPPSAAELHEALGSAELAYFADAHGTPEWRAHLTSVLAEQIRAELDETG